MMVGDFPVKSRSRERDSEWSGEEAKCISALVGESVLSGWPHLSIAEPKYLRKRRKGKRAPTR